MSPSNYIRTFSLGRAPHQVFDAICNVTAWWTIDVDGGTRAVGDEFTVQFGDVHLTKQRITEVVPAKRIVWLVTESHLPWLADKKEWKGTTIVFDITATPQGSQLTFTHIGLTPQVECFEQCEKGWDYFIGTSLLQLITEATGLPDTTQRSHMDTIGHVHPTNA